MKGVLILFLATLVVCQGPETHEGQHEERVHRRKQIQKEICDCILKEDISSELKTKLEENQDEDLRHTLHLFLNKLDTKDREVIRKCRREVFGKMREMFKNRKFDSFMNRTRYRYHPLLHERYNHTEIIVEKKPEVSITEEKKPETSAQPSPAKSSATTSSAAKPSASAAKSSATTSSAAKTSASATKSSAATSSAAKSSSAKTSN
jgi:hypothetical protein